MRRYPQADMTTVYGLFHYLSIVVYDMFFRGEVVGQEYIPKTGAFLIAVNHASHLDAPTVGAQVPRQMSFFARKTLWKPGVAAWWLDAVGTIPVDLEGSQDIGGLKRVLRALADNKVLILFPEGTRTLDGKLQPPKPGIGLIICRSQVPVIPARIFGSYEAFGKGISFPRLGKGMSIVFGPPLTASEYDIGTGKDRYLVASERVMERIAALELPLPAVI